MIVKESTLGMQVRYTEIRNEVARVAEQCGRLPGSVRVVAVSKTVGMPEVAQAIAQGAVDFGENRPELLASKAAAFPQQRWHMIGNIQSRRIPDIVEHAALIHSVCKFDHVRKIGRAATARGRVQDILVEVNVSGEESKSGITAEECFDFVADAFSVEGIRVCGLMTMAPIGDASAAHDVFAALSELRVRTAERLASHGAQADAFVELSMGMTQDWREAVACGATIVRIGRAVFPAAV